MRRACTRMRTPVPRKDVVTYDKVPCRLRRADHEWRRLSRRHWTAADTVTISLTAVSGAEISWIAMKLRSGRRLESRELLRNSHLWKDIARGLVEYLNGPLNGNWATISGAVFACSFR
jgi:hypothetical protein